MTQQWEMFRIRYGLLRRIREIAVKEKKLYKQDRPNMQLTIERMIDHYEAMMREQ